MTALGVGLVLSQYVGTGFNLSKKQRTRPCHGTAASELMGAHAAAARNSAIRGSIMNLEVHERG